MKRGIFAAFLFLVCLSTGWGEVVIEFDGKKWGGEFEDPDFDKRVVEEGLCIVADAKLRVGDFLADWNFDQLQPHALRFAMRGIEGKGAVIDSAKGIEGERRTTIIVFCTPKSVTAGYFSNQAKFFIESRTMDVDFGGVDKFLEVLKNGVKDSEEDKDIPIAVLMIRPKCSYELMIRTLQLIRSSGCKNIAIKIDEETPDPNDIEVHTDPNVLPPVAHKKEADQRGRIVINIRDDSKVTGNDLQVLDTDEAIKNYITKSKEDIIAAGLIPKIHLRGESEILFKESRKVIKLAAEAGVTQVVFAVYERAKLEAEAAEVKPDSRVEMAEVPEEAIEAPKQEGKRWLEHFIKPREQDLGMALPENHAEKFEGKMIEIVLNAQGQVFLGKDKLLLDQDAKKREMPLLQSELEKLKADGQAVMVKIHVDPAAEQQRVIDLLNTLAAVGISTVTFTDVIEK